MGIWCHPALNMCPRATELLQGQSWALVARPLGPLNMNLFIYLWPLKGWFADSWSKSLLEGYSSCWLSWRRTAKQLWDRKEVQSPLDVYLSTEREKTTEPVQRYLWTLHALSMCRPSSLPMCGSPHYPCTELPCSAHVWTPCSVWIPMHCSFVNSLCSGHIWTYTRCPYVDSCILAVHGPPCSMVSWAVSAVPCELGKHHRPWGLRPDHNCLSFVCGTSSPIWGLEASRAKQLFPITCLSHFSSLFPLPSMPTPLPATQLCEKGANFRADWFGLVSWEKHQINKIVEHC